MALSLAETFRASIGNKTFRGFKVTITTGAAATTITAGSCDMNYIDHAILQPGAQGSMALALCQLSTATGTFIDQAGSTETNDVFHLLVIGY